MDHNRRPHNWGHLKDPDRASEGHNPLCGDHLTVYLKLDAQEKVDEVAFVGDGCAISKASASMMTDGLMEKPAPLPTKILQRGLVRVSAIVPMLGTHGEGLVNSASAICELLLRARTWAKTCVLLLRHRANCTLGQAIDKTRAN
jgi:hypothetical protein